MPVPLIELQQRLSIVGELRMGGEKPERGVGRKLDAWRITSASQRLIEQAAELYGGEVTQWQSPNGASWQTYTSAPELPVLLMPNYSLRRDYQLWEGATKRMRLCDGIDEELSGGPCICNAEGVDKCDLYTRLVVCLPELDTLLGWKLISRGANAAHELPTMVDAARATGQTFVPARLRIEQRRGVVDGQVTRFVVPTLDLDVGYAALRAAADPLQPALPPPSADVEGANGAALAPPSRRQAASFGPVAISPEGARADDAPDVDGETSTRESEQTLRISDGQKAKLNVLVGTLREQGKIETAHLYDAVGGRLRQQAGLDLAATTPDYVDDKGVTHKALDDDGTLHWAPLRETLTRAEAHYLIERLSPLEPSGETAGDEPAAQASADELPDESADLVPDESGHITVPFNQFPPGY